MLGLTTSFFRCRSGATAIEYAMIASLVSIVIFASATSIGSTLSSTFTSVAGKVL